MCVNIYIHTHTHLIWEAERERAKESRASVRQCTAQMSE